MLPFLEGLNVNEEKIFNKEIFSKTDIMTDSFGSRLKLVREEIEKSNRVDKDVLDKIPKDLEVTYSIYGEKPKLGVEFSGKGRLFNILPGKRKEITEEGVKTNIEPNKEGVNFHNQVSVVLEVDDKEFAITGRFKDETNTPSSNLLPDSERTRSGLGRITISEIIKTDTITSPLAE